jgi:dTDP-4-dehydrorhamnose reductase
VKVLITGASGQVGAALQATAPAGSELHALTHRELDVADSAAVCDVVSNSRPDLIINAAAYTAVDKAEAEPELAFAINGKGPNHLAQAARGIPDCRLIHISTDYVFDGSSPEPYQTRDTVHPLSVYGRSKREGEQAVIEVLGARAVVLRTAWVYAARGKNFLLTMLRLMRELGAVRVVADQYGCPTCADSIAEAIWIIARRTDVHGVLHWTDAGKASWYDFALAIAEDGQSAGLLQSPVEVTPITTAEYPTAAYRPANSLLDIRESVATLELQPMPWRERMRATLASIPLERA